MSVNLFCKKQKKKKYTLYSEKIRIFDFIVLYTSIYSYV